MSLSLYYHPLSSFCHKVLIALYENDTPFDPVLVDLSDEASRAELLFLWPIGKFPVLSDEARDQTVPESSTIIEYLAQHYPGPSQLVPDDPDLARETRLRDRFFDLYVHQPMQKIVTDRLRPHGRRDPHGVDEARVLLRTAYGMVERGIDGSEWTMGDQFTLADCAAAPALHYARRVLPMDDHPRLAAYLERLEKRPSYARVLAEAQPYQGMFPSEE
jgi:glutathione S-transferase